MTLRRILKILFFSSIVLLFSSYTYIFNKLPDDIYYLKRTTFYDYKNEPYLSTINNHPSTWVNLDEVSPNVINALVSIEDKKFYTHSGFDFLRIVKTLVVNTLSREIKGGASTITQQYVKNIFLTNSQTYSRKLKEVYLALLIENKYSKNDILEGFLNSVYFGHGIYGIEDASHYFYNKPAIDLTIEESASLIAILNAPEIYSPIKQLQNNIKRVNLIMSEMYKDGNVSKDDFMNRKPILLNINKNYKSNIYYFQNEVINKLNDISFSRRFSKIDVYTTLNKDLYNKANHIIKNTPNELEASIYVIEPNTGNILTIIGGKNYTDSEFNRATNSYRQPGSSIKPFLYYTALEYGFKPFSTFESTPTTFYIDGTKSYSPRNYDNQYFNDEITMTYALATSDNIYAVKTLLFLGVDSFIESLKDFNFKQKISSNPTIALGTNTVSLEEITSAYNCFASYGKQPEPKIINRVFVNDNLIYQNYVKNLGRFDEENTYIINDMLTHMFNTNLNGSLSVTGSSITNKLSHRYSGKSGSTDFDNWMIGYNPQITIGVWTGYDNNNKLLEDDKGYAKQIWAELIEFYMMDKENAWFTKPEFVGKRKLDLISGKTKGSNLEDIYYKTT
ncbi:transglycosylase domain-containing protein [Mycoplasmatota bacterium zrk1]